MSKEKSSIVLIVLLVVSLVINWFTWSSTNELKNQVSQLRNGLSNIRSQVSSEVSGIRGIVQNMREDAKWWSPADVEFLEMDREKALVKVSWNLKEYKQDSEIMFNYKLTGQSDYTQIPADQHGNGYFSVTLPVELPLEPIWEMRIEQSVSREQDRDSRISREAAIEKKIKMENDYRLSYYISRQDEGTILTSEKRNMLLDKLSYKLFKSLSLYVTFHEQNQISIHFRQIGPDDTQYHVKEIYLESRDNQGQTLERWTFESLNPIDDKPANVEESEIGFIRVEAAPQKDYDKLFIVVEYKEDLVIEKEIY